MLALVGATLGWSVATSKASLIQLGLAHNVAVSPRPLPPLPIRNLAAHDDDSIAWHKMGLINELRSSCSRNAAQVMPIFATQPPIKSEVVKAHEAEVSKPVKLSFQDLSSGLDEIMGSGSKTRRAVEGASSSAPLRVNRRA